MYGFADKKGRVEAGGRSGLQAPGRRPEDPVPVAERQQSGTAAYTKPIPVVVVGPRPLDVRDVGGGKGGKDKPPEGGQKDPEKTGFWGGVRGELWKGAKAKFDKTGVGRGVAKARKGIAQAFGGEAGPRPARGRRWPSSASSPP